MATNRPFAESVVVDHLRIPLIYYATTQELSCSAVRKRRDRRPGRPHDRDLVQEATVGHRQTAWRRRLGKSDGVAEIYVLTHIRDRERPPMRSNQRLGVSETAAWRPANLQGCLTSYLFGCQVFPTLVDDVEKLLNLFDFQAAEGDAQIRRRDGDGSNAVVLK